MTAATRPVAIKIDPDIKERVRRLATARNRSAHWLMREAITQYVEREEKREEPRPAPRSVRPPPMSVGPRSGRDRPKKR